MFGSTVLEVAIGLVFVYLVLSVVCSAVKEVIARILGLRSRTLEDGIRNLLVDGQDQSIVEEFFAHPLIRSLSRNQGRNGERPSYIPSQTFAAAFLDVVRSRHIGDAVLTAEGLRKAVAGSDSQVLGVLRPFLAEAGEDLRAIRADVEQWFDAAMDRVSGWYKRRAQVFLWAIAAFVTVLLNVDTVKVVDSLVREDAVRAAVVATAERIAQDSTIIAPDSALQHVGQLTESVQQLGLPLGWAQPAPVGLLGWVAKLLGLLITIVAVTQGAPFWFDLLNRFVDLRSTGRRPGGASGARANPGAEEPSAVSH